MIKNRVQIENPVLLKVKARLAMTLAEVMITLIVVGVVAAMVIPAMMNAYQDTVFKHQYNEMFSILSNLNRMALNDNLTLISSSSPGNISVDSSIFEKYLNLSKFCTYADYSDVNSLEKCWTQDTIYGLNGSDLNSYDPFLDSCKSDPSYVLPNGAIICRPWAYSNGTVNGVSVVDMIVYIDLNGTKKPNVFGRDVHRFTFETAIGGRDTKVRPSYSTSFSESTTYNTTNIKNGCLGLNVSGTNNRGYTCGALWLTVN